MDLLKTELKARADLIALRNHDKKAALDARLCQDTLRLTQTPKSELLTMAVDVIESLLMYTQHNGIRPHQLKDELIARCEDALAKGGSSDLN